ncbi:MAG: hypothetical protein AAGH88_13965 [Planctomycetota bacterium]
MHPPALHLAQTPNWWWSTLTSDQGLLFVFLLAGLLLITLYLGWRLRQVAKAQQVTQTPRPTLRQRLSDESGTATVEFVLVFPFLLTTSLLLLQTVLVFTGLFYVNYAAYAAARSAVVYVPLQVQEEANTITALEGGYKFDRIRSAAMIALIPICGEEAGTDGTGVPGQIVQGVQEAYQAQGQTPPGWVENLLPGRVAYAMNHTEVLLFDVYASQAGEVVYESAGGTYTYGPRDAIGVEVRHEMALTVPVASRVFTLGSGNSGTYSPPSRSGDTPGPPGRWTEVTARAILTNEGVDRSLPDLPEVPRQD